MLSKKFCLALLLCVACSQSLRTAHGEYLFNSFLTPSFDTLYSQWDVFYTPSDNPNYPDITAPYGAKQTASAAGITPPANSNPSDPAAFWDTRNATITQNGTANAFIIGPGVAGSGNIYSFAAATAYVLNNASTGGVGNVAFQYQTDGTFLDFNAIRLQYTNVSGNTISLAPNEYIREYRNSGSSFGGLTNRSALQWNLSSLGITSYRIVFNALGSSNSFQRALLDTSATYGAIVPASRTWTLSGTSNWNIGTNWQQGSTSVENGNVRFANQGAVNITLDADHTVGELQFNSPANVTVSAPGGFTLTSNTGITTASAASGVYTFNGAYAFNALNLFNVSAGEVWLNGPVSGNHGLQKDGDGTLTLAGNNTFTGSVAIGAGTLRLTSGNAYTGATSVVNGTLIIGTDGALGAATTNVAVGADSASLTFPGIPSASLVLDGNRTLNRNLVLANGTYEKRLVATNAPTAATFTGNVNISTSDNVKLTATTATDRLVFSGAISGGATNTGVTVNGPGTVIFSGAGKTYASMTTVNQGTLQIASGSAFSGAGAINIAIGATLRADGVVSRTGLLNVSGTYQSTGASTLSGGLTVNSGGTVVASGGTLTLGGAVTNNGTIRLSGGANLAAGGASSFVNNGVIDLLDGSAQLPANFVNGSTGAVLTQNSLRFTSVSKNSNGVVLTINSLVGFSYQLQRSSTLGAGASYVNVGTPLTGSNGGNLTLTDPAPTSAQAFYRVVLSR